MGCKTDGTYGQMNEAEHVSRYLSSARVGTARRAGTPRDRSRGQINFKSHQYRYAVRHNVWLEFGPQIAVPKPINISGSKVAVAASV